MAIEKHKWKLVGDTYFTIERINTDKNISVTYPTIATVNTTFINNEEAKANALLISKAPEMLEMLQRLRKDVDFGFSSWGNDKGLMLSEELESLIKEATEL